MEEREAIVKNIIGAQDSISSTRKKKRVREESDISYPTLEGEKRIMKEDEQKGKIILEEKEKEEERPLQQNIFKEKKEKDRKAANILDHMKRGRGKKEKGKSQHGELHINKRSVKA